MGKWKARRLQRDGLRWLERVERSATSYIDAGDLDLDDVLYRGRDAARVLIGIFGPDPAAPPAPVPGNDQKGDN